MKKLMMMAVLAATCAAMADEPKPASAEAPRRAMTRGEMPRRAMSRGGMSRGEMMRGGAFDPISRFVSMPGMDEKLGLSAEQKEKLAAFSAPNRDSERANRDKMRAAMEKQNELMKADSIDEAAVMAAVDEVFELRKAAAKEQVKRTIGVRSILTAEQLEKVRELMKSRRPAMRQRPNAPVAEKPAAAEKAPAAAAEAAPKAEAK